MNFIVPPGGPAGFRQMTPASRAALFPGSRSRRPSSKRRKKRTARAAGGSRKRSSGKRKTGRLPKFGSPAWRKKFKLDKKR